MTDEERARREAANTRRKLEKLLWSFRIHGRRATVAARRCKFAAWKRNVEEAMVQRGAILAIFDALTGRNVRLVGEMGKRFAQSLQISDYLQSVETKVEEQAEHVEELEAQLQLFRDFNTPLLRVAAEEEPGAWDHLQGEDTDD